MRKLLMYGMLLLVICFVSGCGNNGTEERLQTGAERAMELGEEAQSAVDAVNEDTKKLEENASALEE